MYVDAAEACNDLTFLIGERALDGTTIASREWTIRITQYECGYENLAPPGCTQYYYGEDSAVFKSYNFDGGYHLADQEQSICIRREKGSYKICYATADPYDFQISGGKAMKGLFGTK